MPQRKPYLVIGMLAAALLAGAPIGAHLMSRKPLDSSNQPLGSSADEPAAATGRKRGQRMFVERLARPTGEGNARIRIKSGDTRTLSLDFERLRQDQKRYIEDLGKAKRVVNVKGRQKKIREVPKLPKHPDLKLQPGQEEELFPFLGLPELDPEEEELLIRNCLMITDVGVVEDPERTTGTGAWTFGTLMTNIANRSATGIEPAVFVGCWLEQWGNAQTINSISVPGRKHGIEKLITQPWQNHSGVNKPLDLTIAPFRLLAIVCRLDLRDNLVLGNRRIGGGGAGEARFVFCAYDMDDPEQTPLRLTVILEFQIKRKDFHGVREWAEQWYALKNIPLGTTRYNKALQRITDQFTAAGADPESPPNLSALSQLRTNELELDEEMALAGKELEADWELREFRIDVNNSGDLRQVTVKQSPDRLFREVRSLRIYLSGIAVSGAADGGGSLLTTSCLLQFSTSLAQYVNGTEADILAQEHHVPAKLRAGHAFLGGSARTPQNAVWNDPGIRNGDARHLFSLGTCSGCHAGEAFPRFHGGDSLTDDTPPAHFTHVRPRKLGVKAQLSPFLTGKTQNGDEYFLEDPAGQLDGEQKKKRPFHDLSIRAHDLAGVVEYGVIYEKERRLLHMVH